ncbi:hypothetical protein DFH08DRAFT_453960 [Mycena albidolilacea]|uniref:Uncharacterized protein n=1 Tax=Mycena albidolilacea TaxID=1033008 RepID=A0AAD6Z8P7_9AGAR|nr:hypothetical protein DFH08DRAFT_453960 [Mycena albidolilacea]
MSTSSFLRLFCCCNRAARDEDSVDETSHLIPSNLDSTPPRVVFTDHQKIQERLVTIVRAKERKMVNVNSQIPFNLHNRVITPHPSLSRSVSLSTGHHGGHENNVLSSALEPLTVQLRTPPSPLGSARNPSQSNSRSISLTRENMDSNPNPHPILNVRLINKVLPTNMPQRVGRPRYRAYGSPSSAEYYPNGEAETRQARRSPERVAQPVSAAASSAAPPPALKALDEICLSWGD